MSDIEKIKSALLIAYIGDIGCTLTNEDCNDLTKYIANLEGTIKAHEADLPLLAATERVKELEAENAALRKANRWRPTSELPEEGQMVEVLNAKSWDVNTWNFSGHLVPMFRKYTHWRPFTPPQEEE